MMLLVVLLLLVSCERERPPPPPTTKAPAIALRPLPPCSIASQRTPSGSATTSPPPPPPPEITLQPPPARVAWFLRAHAGDAAPWRASYTHRGARKRLTPADAAELARRLARDESYIDGDYGCVGEPVEYELARGEAAMVFSEDCGHMQLGDDDHAALFSSEMLTFLRSVRGWR